MAWLLEVFHSDAGQQVARGIRYFSVAISIYAANGQFQSHEVWLFW